MDPETCSSGAPIKEDGASGVSLHHLAIDPREAFQNLRMLMSFLFKRLFLVLKESGEVLAEMFRNSVFLHLWQGMTTRL